MKQELETYGKRSWIKEQVNFFTVYNDEKYKAHLEPSGIGIYRPPIRRGRFLLGMLLICGCITTPGTNFFIPKITKWSLS